MGTHCLKLRPVWKVFDLLDRTRKGNSASCRREKPLIIKEDGGSQNDASYLWVSGARVLLRSSLCVLGCTHNKSVEASDAVAQTELLPGRAGVHILIAQERSVASEFPNRCLQHEVDAITRVEPLEIPWSWSPEIHIL